MTRLRVMYNFTLLQLLILSSSDVSARTAEATPANNAVLPWLCAVVERHQVRAQNPPNRFSLSRDNVNEGNAVQVRQGNAKARSIKFGSDSYLYTRDLTPCIAILIVDENSRKCHMIHTDAFDTSGIGGKTLESTLHKLGLLASKKYQIGLIGGASADSIDLAESKIKQLLPKAEITLKEQGKHAAYLTGSGVMTSSKRALQDMPGLGP